MVAKFSIENIIILLIFCVVFLFSICLCYRRYIYEGSNNFLLPIQASNNEILEVSAHPYTDVIFNSSVHSVNSDTIQTRAVSFKSTDLDYIPKPADAVPRKIVNVESVLFYE